MQETKEQRDERLRVEWHVHSVNMSKTVTDYSKVEGMISDFWLKTLDTEIQKALENQKREIKKIGLEEEDELLVLEALDNI